MFYPQAYSQVQAVYMSSSLHDKKLHVRITICDFPMVCTPLNTITFYQVLLTRSPPESKFHFELSFNYNN